MRLAAAFACALMLMPSVALAQLQPGSTGGTIGKTNKSISGGEESSPPSDVQEPPRVKRHSISKGGTSPDEGAKAERAAGNKVFHNPTLNGVRVNWCLTGLEGCGQGAATALCQSKGLTRATDFKWEVAAPAYALGDHTTCTGFCGAFTVVSCE